ncbi:hypothetical protein Y032_1104g3609 [Ancylostoma ceylanicum]|nr:hypothetical protein Y032_1104g3609 [Ancylostoma ceylanicum]
MRHKQRLLEVFESQAESQQFCDENGVGSQSLHEILQVELQCNSSNQPDGTRCSALQTYVALERHLTRISCFRLPSLSFFECKKS